MDVVETIIVSLITGLISGLLSGWIVTKKYRLKDKKETIERSFRNGLYNYYEYIGKIANEIDWLIDHPGEDKKDLYKLVRNCERIFDNTEVQQRANKEISDLLAKIFNVLNELQVSLEVEEYDLKGIRGKLMGISLSLLQLSR